MPWYDKDVLKYAAMWISAWVVIVGVFSLSLYRMFG